MNSRSKFLKLTSIKWSNQIMATKKAAVKKATVVVVTSSITLKALQTAQGSLEGSYAEVGC